MNKKGVSLLIGFIALIIVLLYFLSGFNNPNSGSYREEVGGVQLSILRADTFLSASNDFLRQTSKLSVSLVAEICLDFRCIDVLELDKDEVSGLFVLEKKGISFIPGRAEVIHSYLNEYGRDILSRTYEHQLKIDPLKYFDSSDPARLELVRVPTNGEMEVVDYLVSLPRLVSSEYEFLYDGEQVTVRSLFDGVVGVRLHTAFSGKKFRDALAQYEQNNPLFDRATFRQHTMLYHNDTVLFTLDDDVADALYGFDSLLRARDIAVTCTRLAFSNGVGEHLPVCERLSGLSIVFVDDEYDEINPALYDDPKNAVIRLSNERFVFYVNAQFVSNSEFSTLSDVALYDDFVVMLEQYDESVARLAEISYTSYDVAVGAVALRFNSGVWRYNYNDEWHHFPMQTGHYLRLVQSSPLSVGVLRAFADAQTPQEGIVALRDVLRYTSIFEVAVNNQNVAVDALSVRQLFSDEEFSLFEEQRRLVSTLAEIDNRIVALGQVPIAATVLKPIDERAGYFIGDMWVENPVLSN